MSMHTTNWDKIRETLAKKQTRVTGPAPLKANAEYNPTGDTLTLTIPGFKAGLYALSFETKDGKVIEAVGCGVEFNPIDLDGQRVNLSAGKRRLNIS